MQLNKVLQRENDRLKEELKETREHDILTFVWSWDMFHENQRLWELVEGAKSDLDWYGMTAYTKPSITHIKVYGYHTVGKHIKERKHV